MLLSYNPKWADEDVYFLVKAVLTLENEEEVLRFLEDICTITEIKELAQRLKVAKNAL